MGQDYPIVLLSAPAPVLLPFALARGERRVKLPPAGIRCPRGVYWTLHITPFEGSCARSSFRVQPLLPSLQAIHDKVNDVAARFVHLVTSDGALVAVTPRFDTVSR